MKKNSKIYIIYSILISIFSMSIADKTINGDTFSTIKIGQYILKYGLDFNEHLNFNSNLHYHHARWLFEVLISFVYNNLGFFGIYLLVMILSMILGLVIFNVLNKMQNNILVSFIATILTMITMSPFSTARAQICSYIFLILEVLFIEKIIETKKKRYILYTVLCSIAIANLHTSVWIMVIILFMPYFAEYIISRFRVFNNQNRFYSSTNDIKLLLITFIIVLLSGLCTPIGLIVYTYPFKTLGGISKIFINELQPSTLLGTDYFLFYIIIFIILAIYYKPKIKVSDIFMYSGLLLMSLLARRNCAFLFLISPIFFTRLFNNVIREKKEKFEKATSVFTRDSLFILITIIFILIYSLMNFILNIRKDYVNKFVFPVEATDYIIENIDIDNMRIYNGFNYGSYLEFRGLKVFLDSRSEVYCEEFNNTTILKDWYHSNYLLSYYKDIFDKYDFTHLLLYKNEGLDYLVEHDKDYKKIYEDKSFVLYEKIK